VLVFLASAGGTADAFFDAAGQFFTSLEALRPGNFFLALAFFALYILVRSRAIFNALRAAYPKSQLQWRRVWGAYVAAYGLNGVLPAGGGTVVQVVLTKASIEEATYPTVMSSLCAPAIFDACVASALLLFAFTSGTFPRPKAFGGLQSFDIAFFARHPQFTLFVITAIAVVGLTAFALLSRRIATLLVQLRQGWAILRDRRRYVIGMLVPQSAGWLLRGAAYFEMLAAFGVGASVQNAALVLAALVIAALVPVTPGGAGVQQALLLAIFASRRSGATVAAFAVGEQIAFVALALAMGFAAIVFIFDYRSFRAVLRESRARRAADDAVARERTSV
jgi:uncharacterized membrane protein YbhN (UPF0104 family)